MHTHSYTHSYMHVQSTPPHTPKSSIKHTAASACEFFMQRCEQTFHISLCHADLSLYCSSSLSHYQVQVCLFTFAHHILFFYSFFFPSKPLNCNYSWVIRNRKVYLRSVLEKKISVTFWRFIFAFTGIKSEKGHPHPYYYHCRDTDKLFLRSNWYILCPQPPPFDFQLISQPSLSLSIPSFWLSHLPSLALHSSNSPYFLISIP